MASVVGSSQPWFHRRIAAVALAALAGCAQGTASDAGDVVDDVEPPDGAPGADARRLADARPADAGCTIQNVNLLANPNFDDTPAAVGWVEDPFDLAIIQAPPAAVTPDTGAMVAWMGGYASTSDDHAYQDVTIPASATSLAVTGKIRVETEETGATAYDNASVRLLTTGGAVVLDVGAFSNVTTPGSFLPISATAPSAHAGETLRLQFDSSTDGSLNTSFFFDTFAITVTACVP